MSLTKPILGLVVGGTLGLIDGLSGFFDPSLAPMMGSVITFSMLPGASAGRSRSLASFDRTEANHAGAVFALVGAHLRMS